MLQEEGWMRPRLFLYQQREGEDVQGWEVSREALAGQHSLHAHAAPPIVMLVAAGMGQRCMMSSWEVLEEEKMLWQINSSNVSVTEFGFFSFLLFNQGLLSSWWEETSPWLLGSELLLLWGFAKAERLWIIPNVLKYRGAFCLSIARGLVQTWRWLPASPAPVWSGLSSPSSVQRHPVWASSCPTGSWGLNWRSRFPLALSGGAPTRCGMRAAKQPSWWSSAAATPPSRPSPALSGGSARWWRAWAAGCSSWWPWLPSWAAACPSSSPGPWAGWQEASSSWEVSAACLCCGVDLHT